MVLYKLKDMIKFISLIFVIGITLTAHSQTYFNKYQAIADSFELKYGIPSSVMLGIGYFESGGGKSVAAKYLNNHFGIKGSNNLKSTHNIKSSYKYYESATKSFEAFCLLMMKKDFYSKLKGNSDANKWIVAIGMTNYATTNTWCSKVLSIIKTNKLT